MNTVTDVAAHIKQIWSSSAFMNLLKIEIDEIHCGGATVKMPIDFWHPYQSLAGCARRCFSGISRCSYGHYRSQCRRGCADMSFNINFISNLPGTGTAIVKARSNTMGRQLWSLWRKWQTNRIIYWLLLRRLCLSPDILMKYPENGNEGMKY